MSTSQFMPSSIPTPVMALHGYTAHCLVLVLVSPISWMISAWVRGPGKSCLLAKTRTGTPFNSSSCVNIHYFKHQQQLLSGRRQFFSVCRVDYEDDCLRVWIVASPVLPDPFLSCQVPNLELDVLVLHGFHVECRCYVRRAYSEQPG